MTENTDFNYQLSPKKHIKTQICDNNPENIMSPDRAGSRKSVLQLRSHLSFIKESMNSIVISNECLKAMSPKNQGVPKKFIYNEQKPKCQLCQRYQKQTKRLKDEKSQLVKKMKQLLERIQKNEKNLKTLKRGQKQKIKQQVCIKSKQMHIENVIDIKIIEQSNRKLQKIGNNQNFNFHQDITKIFNYSPPNKQKNKNKRSITKNNKTIIQPIHPQQHKLVHLLANQNDQFRYQITNLNLLIDHNNQQLLSSHLSKLNMVYANKMVDKLTLQ